MPISHDINTDLGIVFSTLVGQIVETELLQSYKQLYEDNKWQPGFHELVDLRQADLSEISSNALRKLSALVENHAADKTHSFKTAILASDNLPFGLARLYEAVSEDSPENVMVFRDIKKALEWLGLDDAFMV